ncbi:MAG: 16S rRNA (guanine(527)-N(7))-methyltransferase RsmG [Candidatus Limnocylindrales bacterium]
MRAALEGQARLLLAWSPLVNLTAIRDPAKIALEHVGDSLAAVPILLEVLAARRPPRRPVGLLDIGSGAGYPGVPVALAIPAAHALLVDSVSRKAAFLDAVASAGREAFRAHGEEPVPLRVGRMRAEELAGDPGQRDRWEVVTARAVADLPALVALALPLVRPGGRFVAWKRDGGDGSFQAEVDAALPLSEELGADPRPEIARVALSGLEDHRLVIIRKRRPTPAARPRLARTAVATRPRLLT